MKRTSNGYTNPPLQKLRNIVLHPLSNLFNRKKNIIGYLRQIRFQINCDFLTGKVLLNTVIKYECSAYIQSIMVMLIGLVPSLNESFAEQRNHEERKESEE